LKSWSAEPAQRHHGLFQVQGECVVRDLEPEVVDADADRDQPRALGTM